MDNVIKKLMHAFVSESLAIKKIRLIYTRHTCATYIYPVELKLETKMVGILVNKFLFNLSTI